MSEHFSLFQPEWKIVAVHEKLTAGQYIENSLF